MTIVSCGNDDDGNGPLKDYTYMYRKQSTDNENGKKEVDPTTSTGCTDCGCETKRQTTGSTATSLQTGSQQTNRSPISPSKSDGRKEFKASPVSSAIAEDISSVSTSIVDYVRRSMSEAGVTLCDADESGNKQSDYDRPPPLPVKTSQQTANRVVGSETIGVDQGPLINGGDELITSSAWEPTHMSWDEVSCACVFWCDPLTSRGAFGRSVLNSACIGLIDFGANRSIICTCRA
jgi:hypothetical protein